MTTVAAAPATATPSAAPTGDAPASGEGSRNIVPGPGGARDTGAGIARDGAAKGGLVPPAPGEKAKPEAPKAPEKRKYKLKVDGQEQEAEYTDDQVAVELQMAKAARKRMQEAAEVKKWRDDLISKAKQDPWEVMKALGIEDPDALAEQRTAERYRREVMTEQERAQLAKDEELKSYKQKLEAYETQQRQAYEQQQMAQLEQQIEADIRAAFEVASFDWNPDNLEAVGKVIQDALEHGVELTPHQVAAQVKAQQEERDRGYTDKVKGRILGLKGNDLLSELGDDVVKEVLRASIAKHSAAQAAKFDAPAGVPEMSLPDDLFGKSKKNKGQEMSASQAWRKLGR